MTLSSPTYSAEENRDHEMDHLSVFLLTCFVPVCLAADKDKKEEKPSRPNPSPNCASNSRRFSKTRHTPGVSVAIVHKDGPEWVAGLGMADVAANRATTADTLFRIGSTSKAFASLSILMLADQGKLSLDDPVHKLAPDVWFENRWEATDPIRVVNLLEHTTGWDDMHLREYAKDASRHDDCAKASTTTTTRASPAGLRARAWPIATPVLRSRPTSSRNSPASASKTTCSRIYSCPSA